MKKLMIALAIVAIASVAQAELLASWTFAGGAGTASANGSAANIGEITVGNLVRTGLGMASTAAGQFSSNGFNDGGSIDFSLVVNANYQIAGASLNSTSIQGSNTGPGTTQWQLNGVDAGAPLVRTASASTAWGAALGDIDAGSHTLSMIAVGTANVTGGAISAAGSYRINDLTLNGDIVAVPEPATMSLLGLGALAMVLRRKMKK